jgi:hypothetical protein
MVHSSVVRVFKLVGYLGLVLISNTHSLNYRTMLEPELGLG